MQGALAGLANDRKLQLSKLDMDINTNLHRHHSGNPVCPGRHRSATKARHLPCVHEPRSLAIPQTHSTTKAIDVTFKAHPSPHMFQRTHPQRSPLPENKLQRTVKSFQLPQELPAAQSAALQAEAQHLSVPSFPNTAGLWKS